MKFRSYKSFKKLEACAKEAPDLTKEGALSEERVKSMQVSALNLKLFFATECVDDKIVDELCNLASEAKVHENMKRVQDMEIMNYVKGVESEERAVGHIAMRSRKLPKNASKEAKQANDDYNTELKKLEKFLSENDHFENIVVVGIGGSYLGTKATYHALKAYQTNGKRLEFASNVDPDKLTTIFNELNMKKTLFAIVSKSGSTLEILSQEKMICNHLKKEKLTPKDHLVCVTGKGSPLDDKSRYLETFYMYDYVGGRYSVSSMVGAVPLAFTLGMDVWMSFLQGLSDMDEHALEKNPRKNLPLMGALLGVWNRNFLHCPTEAIIPYSQGMNFWTLHLQQLFMESNGKRIEKETAKPVNWETCPVLMGNVGTEVQHSFFQQIHQGTDRLPVEFICFKEPQYGQDEIIEGSTNHEKLLSNVFAQSISLACGQHVDNPNKYFPGNRMNRVLMAPKLDPYTLGNLLSYYENYVVFQGFVWGINSFDQEGVQLGKVIANQIIDLYKEKRKNGHMKPAKGMEAAKVYIEELENMKSCCRSGKKCCQKKSA